MNQLPGDFSFPPADEKKADEGPASGSQVPISAKHIFASLAMISLIPKKPKTVKKNPEQRNPDRKSALTNPVEGGLIALNMVYEPLVTSFGRCRPDEQVHGWPQSKLLNSRREILTHQANQLGPPLHHRTEGYESGFSSTG